MTFLDLFKDISIKEYKRAGIGALILLGAMYYLYSENQKQAEIIARHSLQLEKRVERLEMDIQDCQTAKFEALRIQVDKSNGLIEKVDNHLNTIEAIIKNK
jgi:hypothetical protein